MANSYLSSIQQQQNEHDEKYSTQISLIKVYNQLYLLNYAPAHTSSTETPFQKISEAINEEKTVGFKYEPFIKEKSKRKGLKFKEIIIGKIQKQRKCQNYLSQEQFTKQLKRRGINKNKQYFYETPSGIRPKKQDFNSMEQKNSNSTASSLTGLLSELKKYDEKRSKVKSNIYCEEEEGKTGNIYKKWQIIHSEMKQILELYMNRVGLGKTLGEIYDEFNKVNKERQTIEGYDKQELLITLDHYLQSLYLDQRQLILFSKEQSLSENKSESPLRRKLKF